MQLKLENPTLAEEYYDRSVRDLDNDVTEIKPLQKLAESHSFRCGMDSLNRFRHEPNAIVKFLL